MKKTVVVAMSNQKGGVGKSTMTVTLASYLYYEMGKSLIVIDCDSHQHSILRMRERDKDTLLKRDEYKHMMMSQFERIQKKTYPIVDATPGNAPEVINDILDSEEHYDLILVDLPGSVSSAGVLTTIINVDYVLTPIVADRIVMQSTLGFATAVLDYKKSHPDIPLRDFLFFWNKVDRRVSPDIFNAYNKILEKLELTVLDTVIPESRRFDKELSPIGKPFFRSTLFPPPAKLLKGSNIDLLAEEICKCLNI